MPTEKTGYIATFQRLAGSGEFGELNVAKTPAQALQRVAVQVGDSYVRGALSAANVHLYRIRYFKENIEPNGYKNVLRYRITGELPLYKTAAKAIEHHRKLAARACSEQDDSKSRENDRVATAILESFPLNYETLKPIRFSSLRYFNQYRNVPTDILLDDPNISPELRNDLQRIYAVVAKLTHELYGEDILEIIRNVHVCSTAARSTGQDSFNEQTAALLRNIPRAKMKQVVKAVNTLYILWNAAEHAEIYRRIENSDKIATPASPRRESVEDAIRQMKEKGKTYGEVLAYLNKLKFKYTFTMHPTDALTPQDRDLQGMAEEILFQGQADGLEPIVKLLLMNDETRQQRPTIQEEVDTIKQYLENTIWRNLKIDQDIRAALRLYYPEDYQVTDEIYINRSYDSWTGGDADGNRQQTRRVQRYAYLTYRETALRLQLKELEGIERFFGVSIGNLPHDYPKLMQSIRDDQTALRQANPKRTESSERELTTPYLLKIKLMEEKIKQEIVRVEREKQEKSGVSVNKGLIEPPYTSEQFAEDYKVIRESLAADRRLHHILESQDFLDAEVRAKRFGLHLVSLDTRQETKVTQWTVAGLLSGTLNENYNQLPEEEKVQRLATEILKPSTEAEIRGDIKAVLQTLRTALKGRKDDFELIKESLWILQEQKRAAERDPKSVRTYIESLTLSLSHMMELLYSFKKVGILKVDSNGKLTCLIDISPLFETRQALQDAPKIIEAFFQNKVGQAYLDARRSSHEGKRYLRIVWGFSDGNKDGGPGVTVMIGRSKNETAAVFNRAAGVLDYLDGRGGTPARALERPDQIISGISPLVWEQGESSHSMTVQGEQVRKLARSLRMAQRYAEQVTTAMMLKTVAFQNTQPSNSRFGAILEHISYRVYHGLVGGPKFWEEWINGPFPLLQHLLIASRNILRAGQKMTFDNARAIAWVCANDISQLLLPSWFGVGSGLRAAIEETGKDWPTIASTTGDPDVRTIVNRAHTELGRMDQKLHIARRWGFSEELLEEIASEMRLTKFYTSQVEENSNGHASSTRKVKSLMPLRVPLRDAMTLYLIQLRDELSKATQEVERQTAIDMIQRTLLTIINANQRTG